MSPRDIAFGTELAARALLALIRARVLAPVDPRRLPALARALALGTGTHTLVAANAARDPQDVAIADDRGTITNAELHRRTTAIAGGLRVAHGAGPKRGVAIMCRNHRGFVEAHVAASRLGATLLLLNTDFPAPQLARVLEREQPAVVVHDAEFDPLFEAAGYDGVRIDAAAGLDALAASGAPAPGRPPTASRIVILTSGTTGTPKSAGRDPEITKALGSLVTLLEAVPFRAGEPMLIGPPLFHGFGLAYLAVGLMLRAPLVLHPRFDAAATLASIEEQRVATFVGVPVMLQRILQLPEEDLRGTDTSSLRAVVSAGSALPPDVSTTFMDVFGDVVHNLYGSTETGFAGIAGPKDLRAAPGTVGRPPFGTTVKILDADRREAPQGDVGHVFVGGPMLFEGYGGGGTKETVGGLMNSGDLGHLDPEGRLLIDGREDDMIVSGGENVFPQEVTDVLASHAQVLDAATVGVDDADFGQRLIAYVVALPDDPPSEDELKAHVKTELARYQVPREVRFVDEIPRNPTGKVLARQLQ